MKVTILICLVSGSVFQKTPLFVTDPLRKFVKASFKSMIKVDENNSKVLYKDEAVFYYYCKDKEGNYVG
jgi:hypothetical protein